MLEFDLDLAITGSMITFPTSHRHLTPDFQAKSFAMVDRVSIEILVNFNCEFPSTC